MALREKVTFGMKWGSISLAVVRITRILTMIVLARILTPEIFGIYAIANTAIQAIAVLGDIGFGAAYIQRTVIDEKDEKIAINTVFAFGLIVDSMMFLVVFLGAPFIASFFETDVLVNILKVMAVLFLLEPAVGICNVILIKRLEFGKIAAAEIIEIFSYSIVAITLAAAGYEIWGLIFGIVISKLTFCILLIKLSGWSPGFEIKPQVALELFGFGKFMWAFGVLSALGGALDKVIIGKYWGAINLGYYHLAFNLCNLPASAFSMLINKISFPAFSKLQDNPERMKRALLKIISNVSMLVLPASLGLIATADELIITVFGTQWQSAIPAVKILALYGLTLSVSSVTGPAFQALGKPNVLLYTSINHHIILIALLILLRNHGVTGICYAVLIPVIVSSGIAFVLIGKYLNIRLKELFKAMSMPVALSILMYGVVKSLKYGSAIFMTIEPLYMLIINVFFGAAIYLITSLLLNRRMFIEFKDTVFEIFRSKGVAFQ